MKRIRLALDWTPNMNHIGFFVARENGFYKNDGIEIEIIDPSADDYKVTPAKKVELGTADLALCPMESIISYRTKEKPFDLKAIATIFQKDVSAIVVLTESGIKRPSDLDGKSYASYKARYEDHIVKQMVKNDGGNGDIYLEYPEKLGIWNTLLSGGYNSTWVFMNWEAADSRIASNALRYFQMKDYGIPYSYSPVIAAGRDLIHKEKELLISFLSATKKGYLTAIREPKKTVDLLSKLVSSNDQHIDLEKSFERSASAFGTDKNWGFMQHTNVQEFIDWIQETRIETAGFKVSDLMTNEFLGG